MGGGPCGRRSAGTGRCSRSGRASGPSKSEDWLAEVNPRVKAERDLTERADTRDHQGVLALVEPFRYADAYELAAAEKPLLAVLDRVTDPRNLGAVARSAEGAGATGVVVPAHGSAVVTPAVARASAGAIEHLPGCRRHESRALPRGGEGRRPLGVRSDRRHGCAVDVGDRSFGRRRAASSAPRERACARSCAERATRSSRFRSRARSSP